MTVARRRLRPDSPVVKDAQIGMVRLPGMDRFRFDST